jgi:CDP-diacylglycerol--serine O-phosphatidyltransferase
MARLPRLPDLLTTANLACGTGSILLASQGQLTLACWLVFAGAVFDVFDGLAARALGGGSPLGAQLDSLADMVTFGVAPAFTLFLTALEPSGPGWHSAIYPGWHWTIYPPLSALPAPLELLIWPVFTSAIVLAIASCWRLAKFNVDTRQTSGFLGLPTPANGLFWVSMVLVSLNVAVHPGPGHEMLAGLMVSLLKSSTTLLIACVGMAILMLSELPLPSLKFKHFRWQGNQVIYLLGGIGAVLAVLYGILAVPLILVLYVLSPLWGRVFPKGV